MKQRIVMWASNKVANEGLPMDIGRVARSYHHEDARKVLMAPAWQTKRVGQTNPHVTLVSQLYVDPRTQTCHIGNCWAKDNDYSICRVSRRSLSHISLCCWPAL